MDYLEKRILEDSAHQFIYGENLDEREKLIQKLLEDYPVLINSETPVAVNLDSVALPNIERLNEDVDNISLYGASREYLFNSVLFSIIKRINDAQLEMPKFIERVNEAELDYSDCKVDNLSELLSLIEMQKETWFTFYKELLTNGTAKLDFDKLPLSYIEIELLIERIKKELNLKSYFALLVDIKEEIPIVSQMALNNLVGARITGMLSMKIMINPEYQFCVYDLSGNFVQNVHDYSTIELDDSYKNLTRDRKRKFFESNLDD